MNSEVSELLRPFVNGNYQINFQGATFVSVRGQGQYNTAYTSDGMVGVTGVRVYCVTNSASANGYANFTLSLNDGKPGVMQIYFSGFDQGEGNTVIPVEAGAKATLYHTEVSGDPYSVGSSGNATFEFVRINPGENGAAGDREDAAEDVQYDITQM